MTVCDQLPDIVDINSFDGNIVTMGGGFRESKLALSRWSGIEDVVRFNR